MASKASDMVSSAINMKVMIMGMKILEMRWLHYYFKQENARMTCIFTAIFIKLQTLLALSDNTSNVAQWVLHSKLHTNLVDVGFGLNYCYLNTILIQILHVYWHPTVWKVLFCLVNIN
jgi:hypothetical protein